MAFPLAAIPIGVSVAKSLFGGRGKPKQDPLRNRYLTAMGQQEGRANRAEDYYLDEATGFDPRAALQEYGEAAYGDFSKKLTREVGEMGGRAVGAGRLDTGFYDVDQGELVTDLAGQYQRDLSSHALDAAGMNLRRIEGVGSYGQGARNTYLDLLAGERDRQTAERNARRQMWGGLAGSALGATATYFGSRGN
jgi:hypothetical protein